VQDGQGVGIGQGLRNISSGIRRDWSSRVGRFEQAELDVDPRAMDGGV